MKKQLLIVDGYNMIGAWPELNKLKNKDFLEEARENLLHQLSNYAQFQGLDIMVVFDAQLVPGVQQRYDKYKLEVIFTKQNETADSYIEKTAIEKNSKLVQVTVATSDLAEQWVIFTKGALRMSAKELYKAVKNTKKVESRLLDYDYSGKYQRNSPWTPEQLQKLQKRLDEL